MEWVLTNPRKGISNVKIVESFNDKFILYIKLSFHSKPIIVGGFLFKTDVAAKRYYSTHYQSIKHNFENPIWAKK